jgi:hypothetical protein
MATKVLPVSSGDKTQTARIGADVYGRPIGTSLALVGAMVP